MGEIGRKKMVALRSRHKFQPEIAKLLLFDRNLTKVVDFVIIYKLYIRIRMKEK